MILCKSGYLKNIIFLQSWHEFCQTVLKVKMLGIIFDMQDGEKMFSKKDVNTGKK